MTIKQADELIKDFCVDWGYCPYGTCHICPEWIKLSKSDYPEDDF